MDGMYPVAFVVLSAIVIFNLLLTLALVRKLNSLNPANNMHVGSGLKLGQHVPDFKAQTLDGRDVTLEDYAGRSSVFVVVSPGCTPCREIIPKVDALTPHAQRAGDDIIFLSVGDVESTRELVAEMDIASPVIVVPRLSSTFMDDYKLSGTPSFVRIDRQGKLEATGYPTDLEQWKKIVDRWDSEQAQIPSLALDGGR